MSIETSLPAAKQLDAAIAAHSRWKYRLKELVESGRTNIDSATATRDDACRLGKWLGEYQPGAVEKEIYHTVRERHAAFHRTIGDILRLAAEGRRKEAEAKMEIGTPFSRLSGELTNELMKWKQLIR